MKFATVGKGGSGKTTIAGMLARLLAADNHKVLAIDGDPNPNLALALGISREEADKINYIPPSIMQIQEHDGVHSLHMTISEKDLIDKYATSAPGKIDLIVMGKPADGSAGSGCMCASHRAVRGVITEMSGYGEFTVTDMEAGLEHLKRGTARNVDTMLVVSEPYYRSLEASARTFLLAKELEIPHVYVIANKIKTDADQAAVEQFCEQYNMPIIGIVPYEEDFMEAERQCLAPIDYSSESAGALAVREIAEVLKQLNAAENKNMDLPNWTKKKKPLSCGTKNDLD